MREQLTEHDVKKIEEEIEYRKRVVRKEAIEAYTNCTNGPTSAAMAETKITSLRLMPS